MLADKPYPLLKPFLQCDNVSCQVAKRGIQNLANFDQESKILALFDSSALGLFTK